ncbi:MAG TPA: DUF1206 domain-containing protein [Chryseosolibacter sp.]|nr:DUF1206 domain-containing protein [Chryseosolibacter sp.]
MIKHVRDFKADQKTWFERFLRFGLISKGVVYCLVGVLAFMAAYDFQTKEPSKAKAMAFVYDQPLGTLLIALITLGMFGYVTLRFFQAFADIDAKGDSTKGLLSRGGYLMSGLIYLGLAVYAINLLVEGRGGENETREFIVSKVLAHRWGAWLVGMAGVLIIGNGIYQAYRGVTGTFMKKIMVIREDLERVFRKAGVIGYLSRGVVLIIIGYLVLHAALTLNPNDAGGTEGAFHFIKYTFGSVLMSIIAVGLIGYGLFNFVRAKFQRIQVS